MVKDKLKLLKQEMKVWTKNSFGNIDEKVQVAIEEIKQLDVKGEEVF